MVMVSAPAARQQTYLLTNSDIVAAMLRALEVYKVLMRAHFLILIPAVIYIGCNRPLRKAAPNCANRMQLTS